MHARTYVCTHKQDISRKQANIVYDGRGLMVTALHTTSLGYRKSGQDWMLLHQGASVVLGEGDEFSLAVKALRTKPVFPYTVQAQKRVPPLLCLAQELLELIIPCDVSQLETHAQLLATCKRFKDLLDAAWRPFILARRPLLAKMFGTEFPNAGSFMVSRLHAATQPRAARSMQQVSRFGMKMFGTLSYHDKRMSFGHDMCSPVLMSMLRDTSADYILRNETVLLVGALHPEGHSLKNDQKWPQPSVINPGEHGILSTTHSNWDELIYADTDRQAIICAESEENAEEFLSKDLWRHLRLDLHLMAYCSEASPWQMALIRELQERVGTLDGSLCSLISESGADTDT